MTAKWEVCHLEVEFMVLIIRYLLVCRECRDRCDSKKQKYWYSRVRASVYVMRGVLHRVSSPSRASSLSRASSPSSLSRASSPSRASSSSRTSSFSRASSLSRASNPSRASSSSRAFSLSRASRNLPSNV